MLKILFSFIIALSFYASNIAAYKTGYKKGEYETSIKKELEKEKYFQDNKVCSEFNISYPGKYEACFNRDQCFINLKGR